jgi:hypothetical protein
MLRVRGEGEGDEGGMREAASHDGGAEGASSTVVPGRREEGSESRCSMNVTWNESHGDGGAVVNVGYDSVGVRHRVGHLILY